MLPALVECLGLIHAVPVAAEVAAVSVVVVAVLVAKVATVTASLIVLERDEQINTVLGSASRLRGAFETHLAGVSPVSSTVHLASASSVHVPSMPRTASVHVPPSRSHVTPPHGAAPRRPTQDGHVATVKVSTAREASSDVQGR